MRERKPDVPVCPDCGTDCGRVRIDNSATQSLCLRSQLAARDQELADLRDWKRSAIEVLREWDRVGALARAVGARLGHSAALETERIWRERDRELAEARGRLATIAEAGRRFEQARKAMGSLPAHYFTATEEETLAALLDAAQRRE